MVLCTIRFLVLELFNGIKIDSVYDCTKITLYQFPSDASFVPNCKMTMDAGNSRAFLKSRVPQYATGFPRNVPFFRTVVPLTLNDRIDNELIIIVLHTDTI